MLYALTLQDPMFVHASLDTREMESRAMVIMKKIRVREDFVILFCFVFVSCVFMKTAVLCG